MSSETYAAYLRLFTVIHEARIAVQVKKGTAREDVTLTALRVITPRIQVLNEISIAALLADEQSMGLVMKNVFLPERGVLNLEELAWVQKEYASRNPAAT